MMVGRLDEMDWWIGNVGMALNDWASLDHLDQRRSVHTMHVDGGLERFGVGGRDGTFPT